MLFLGMALFILWFWQTGWVCPPPPPPSPSPSPIFVEVAGDVVHPGVYAFPHPPSWDEVWRQAGAPPPPPADPGKIPSGSRVEIEADRHYRMGRMSGHRLLALGLAVDLNRATQKDLEALSGIGPTLAARILDYRQHRGPFQTIEELENIAGLGPKKIAQIRPFLLITDGQDRAEGQD